MTDFIGGGVFIGSNPQPIGGKDLGELGGSGSPIPGGFAPSTPVLVLPAETLVSSYWAKASGVVFPTTIGDLIAIGRTTAAYNAKLSVEGDIYALGFILSDTVRITKDGSDNLVFTDPVSGSKTLAQIIAAAGGDVHASGTPANLQLAQWINATTIQGIAISTLVLTQSQITGLVAALAAKAATVHSLVNTTNHSVTGLTTGHFLKALSPTSYGFAAHGLDATAIGLGNVTNDAQVKKIASATNLAIARWNGTTGALLKDSSATVDDSGNINIPTGMKYKIGGVPISIGSGVTPVSNILEWDAGNSWYAPYAAQADGKFDSGVVDPVHATRLNYDGYLYVGALTTGYSVVNGIGRIYDFGYGNTSLQVKKTTTASNSDIVFEIKRDSTAGDVTGHLLNILDYPTTGGVISGSLIRGVIVTTERLNFNPRVVDSGSAVAYMIDTHNVLSTAGAKLLSLKNNGSEKFYVDKGGSIGILNTQVTTNGVTGTAVSSQPFIGSSYKKFIVYLTNFTSAGTVLTFPIAFTVTPYVYGDAAAVAIAVTTTTTTTLTSVGAVAGFIIIEGY